MKTFKDYLAESNTDIVDIQALLNESHDLTEEQDAAIDIAVERILAEQKNGKDLEAVVEEIINEGFLGSIFGGLTGFALGKTIGKTIARVLGIQQGVLYDLMTSRLVGAALGAALGKQI